jgi:hypothetical protein
MRLCMAGCWLALSWLPLPAVASASNEARDFARTQGTTDKGIQREN